MTIPAGWYDDGSGRQRWWDGAQWTEHFAPVADGTAETSEQVLDPEPVAEDSAGASETPTPDAMDASESTAAPEPASSDVAAPEDAVAPEAETSAPEQPTLPYGQPSAPFVAPGATAPTEPLAPYSGAATGQSYPAATPPYVGGAPTQGYPGAAPAYPSTVPAYPAVGPYQAPYAAAPSGPAPLSILGLVGLGIAALGAILSCFPVTMVIGWVLLFAGFVVSLISLFLKGRKWPGIAGLIVSVLGTILAVVMAIVFALTIASTISDSMIDPPSSGTDSGTDDGTSDSLGTDDSSSATVAEGAMGETVTVAHSTGTGEITINSATWGTEDGSGIDPTNGGFLTIDATWTGIDGTTYVGPFYFGVETADGAEGAYDFFAAETFATDQLGPGETATGKATFDVAQSDSYTVIVLDGVLQPVARITVTPSAG